MKKTILLIILLLVIPLAAAKQGHLKLLAVKEVNGGYEGSPADLYLEIRPGSGRVFIEIFPLTKIDTQMSTRFAKQVACDYLDINCDNLDFIYKITAESVIIGGPSAGAAVSTLTIAMLKGIELDENITITGTINSGGLIGPIGGLKAKIDAAKKQNIKKVLIPMGERFSDEDFPNITNATNKTDIFEYGKKLGIEIKEVSNLNSVIYEFTGERIEKEDYELKIDPKYMESMRKLAVDLHNRSIKLINSILLITNKKNDDLKKIEETAVNLTKQGKDAFKEKRYYSSASYFFGANVKFSYVLNMLKNLSIDNKGTRISIIKENIDELNKAISRKEIKTITDLEAYVIVRERIIEAEEYLEKAEEHLNETDINDLVYAAERVYSAYLWYAFFDHRGKEFNMNKEILKKSCQDKLSEAEERYQYLDLSISDIESIKKELDLAYEDFNNGDYELCLFKASKTKAEADSILNLVGIGEDQIDILIEEKLKIIKRNIAKQQKKDVFPVLGYSYYEYADSLKDSDKYSALLYMEYALELSNLDMYFKEKPRITIEKRINKEIIIKAAILFGTGLLTGFLIGRLSKKIRKSKAKKKK